MLICIKNKIMSILITLNEDGYLTLKNDREVILNKIKELEDILKELNPAYEHLEPFYEPNIEIVISDDKYDKFYLGKSILKLPNKIAPNPISFKIGLVENYKGIDDPNLLKDTKIEARKFMSKRFPTYFE